LLVGVEVAFEHSNDVRHGYLHSWMPQLCRQRDHSSRPQRVARRRNRLWPLLDIEEDENPSDDADVADETEHHHGVVRITLPVAASLASGGRTRKRIGINQI